MNLLKIFDDVKMVRYLDLDTVIFDSNFIYIEVITNFSSVSNIGDKKINSLKMEIKLIKDYGSLLIIRMSEYTSNMCQGIPISNFRYNTQSQLSEFTGGNFMYDYFFKI